MKLRVAHWSLVMVTLVAPALRAQSADEALDHAVSVWSKVKTARATFEQAITNSLTGSSATARGEFQEQRPNRLAITFTDPSGDRIVGDGESIWVYLPSSAPGQVIKHAAGDQSAVPLGITGEFLTDPRRRYDVSAAGTATVAGHPTHAVTLVPKSSTQASFDKATIWVDDDDGLIRQFETVESSGVTRRIRINSLDINVPVDRGVFAFKPPAGVRVIDR